MQCLLPQNSRFQGKIVQCAQISIKKTEKILHKKSKKTNISLAKVEKILYNGKA